MTPIQGGARETSEEISDARGFQGISGQYHPMKFTHLTHAILTNSVFMQELYPSRTPSVVLGRLGPVLFLLFVVVIKS